MTSREDPEARPQSWLRGLLLVATPLLIDPNFYRTVVYLAEHGDDGAVGIVLNRPSTEAVASYIPEWQEIVSPPAVIFVGGPVLNDVAIGLARDPAVEPADWSPSPLGVGLLDLGVEAAGVVDVGAARMYSGYAGWTSGQLEAEIRMGSWVTARADTDDVFTDDPATLWRRVLQRQRGAAQLYATFPDDIGFN